MMKFHFIILGLLLLTAIYSCKDSPPSLLMHQTDSLLLEVDSLNSHIVSANIDSLQKVYTHISSNHRILKENVDKFSEIRFDMEDYKQLDSITLLIGFCLDACNDLHSEVSVIESHLEIIKVEITEGIIPDSSLMVKINQEADLLCNVTGRILFRMELLQANLNLYDNMQSEIQEYIKELSGKNLLE